jgi:hypothetical protein
MSASTLNRENHLLSIVSALGGFEEKVLDQEYVREYAAGDEVLGMFIKCRLGATLKLRLV